MRAIKKDRAGLYVFQDKDETLDYIFDWKAWLAGDTIATVVNVATSLTLGTESNTTTTNTFWITGTDGSITSTITTAAGRVKQMSLAFREKVA